MYFLGIDIGGTKIEVALLKIGEKPSSFEQEFPIHLHQKKIQSGYIIHRARKPTERQAGYEQAIQKMKDLSLEVCQKADVKLKEIVGIGTNVPGSVDPNNQQMLMGNTVMFVGKDLRGDLLATLNLNIPIVCENDANCFAYAEALAGAGVAFANETNVPVSEQIGIGIILGTGTGGGLIFRGQILRGSHGGGGEIGHSLLVHDGHPCYCGYQGCAEQYLSGPALEALFGSRMYSQIEKRLKASEIFELAGKLDPVAIAVTRQYQKYLLMFLRNLSNLFDPHYFVLGGGLSRQKEIYNNLEEDLSQITFVPHARPRIYQHKLGDSAGVIGATILALSKVQEGK